MDKEKKVQPENGAKKSMKGDEGGMDTRIQNLNHNENQGDNLEAVAQDHKGWQVVKIKRVRIEIIKGWIWQICMPCNSWLNPCKGHILALLST